MKTRTLLAVLFFTFIAKAQSEFFTGFITDFDGRQIPFVNVYNTSQEKGTYSDNRGYFSIQVEIGDTVELSHQGFRTVVFQAAAENTGKTWVLPAETSGLPEVMLIDESFAAGRRSSELPTSMYIISPNEIKRQGYTDVSRQLRAIPGVNIQEEDGWGLRPNIGFRGSGVERSSNITLMEDGILIAPAPYAAPAAYYFPSFGRMQGVEVMKGASQIKYGPHTTGGAINLISTPIPESTAGFIGLNAGNFGQFNRHIWAGTSTDHFGILVENFSATSSGFKELPSGDDTGFDKDDYLIKLRVNSDQKKPWVHALNFRWSTMNETSNETYTGVTQSDFEFNPLMRYAGSQNDQMVADQNMTSIRYALSNKKGFELSLSAYQTEFKRNWYKLDRIIDDSGEAIGIGSILNNPAIHQNALDILRGSTSANRQALEVKANNRIYYSRGLQFNGRKTWKSEQWNHTLDFGARIHRDEMDRFQWVDLYAMQNGIMQLTESGTPGTESNRIESAKAASGFLEYVISNNRLTIIPGIRYENITLERRDFGTSDPERTGSDLQSRQNNVDAWIPGLRSVFEWNEHWTVNGGVHFGFAPPGTTPGTSPERSVNYELGAQFQNRSTQFRVTGFYSNYSNLLGSDLNAGGGAGTNDLFNGGNALVAGLEALLQWNIAPQKADFQIPISISYTFTQALFQSDFESDYEPWGTVEVGDEMPYLPEHQWSAQVGFEVREWAVYSMISYQSKMRTVAGAENPAENAVVPAYLVADISGKYRLNSHLAITAAVRNISDNIYIASLRPAGVRPGLPRSFLLGVQARF